MPTTVKIRRSGTASATPSALEHGEIAINYADGKVFWKNASNVITSFTFQSYALASHTHSISDVTGLQTALDGKASSSHTHGNISNAGAIGSTADQFVVTTTSGVLTAVSAATARTTLSVQPTASPAFTGTASFGASVSVGTSTPTFVNANYSGVHIHAATATSLRLTNATTGQTATDGFELLQDSGGGAYVWNRESTDLLFGTAATTRLTISSTGTATFAGQIVGQAGAAFTGAASATWNSTDGVQISRATTAGIAIGSTNTPSNTNSFAGWSAYASDGTANVAGGTINFRANENWSSTNHGTDIQFRATPAGSGGALTEVLRITGGGQTLVTAGSGSSGSYKPGLSVSGDDDTGVMQVGGANTLSLVTNGTERVRVGSAGRFTFFANSEKYGIQLNNGATANGPFIGSDGADIFTISTAGGAERVRVKATGAVRFVPLSADPSTGNEAGDVYYNSTTNKLRVYNGTSWVDLH